MCAGRSIHSAALLRFDVDDALCVMKANLLSLNACLRNLVSTFQNCLVPHGAQTLVLLLCDRVCIPKLVVQAERILNNTHRLVS